MIQKIEITNWKTGEHSGKKGFLYIDTDQITLEEATRRLHAGDFIVKELDNAQPTQADR